MPLSLTRLALLAAAVLLAAGLPARAQVTQADRVLTDVAERVYGLEEYTAFDWITMRYDRGTLMLDGFTWRTGLGDKAVAAARKVSGVDEVVNNLEALPTHESDDSVRGRAYLAIYTSPGLEMYSPRGALNPAAEEDFAQAFRFGLESVRAVRGPHAIHIVVSGGRVVLVGRVRNASDKQIAEVKVRPLPGVLTVINRLQVQR